MSLKIQYTAIGGVQNRVLIDGVEQSQNYSQEYTALAAAATLKAADPAKIVTVESRKTYRVDASGVVVPPVDPPKPPIEPKPEEPEPDDPKPPVDPPKPPVEPEEPSEPKPPTAEAHKHFESLLTHPQLMRSWTLRQQSDYSKMRGGTFPGGINPLARYDESLDAGKISLPADTNEAVGIGAFECNWGSDYRWEIGDLLTVQHDYMVSRDFHLYAGTAGDNGRFTNGYKFTNLTRNGGITVELRIHLVPNAAWSHVDVRSYWRKGEGRQERDEIASDIADPGFTGVGKGGGYDRHPGPDSSWVYGQNGFAHPETFQVRSDTWVRVTYEMRRVAEGTRVRVWLADEETDPKLIIASPTDPSRGFLLLSGDERLTGWYMELDTSQETRYSVPMPDRWIGMRNLAVLHGITGDSILGGKPVR